MASSSFEPRLSALLVFSLVLHGSGLGLVAFERRPDSAPVSRVRRDVWAGDSWDVDLTAVSRPSLAAIRAERGPQVEPTPRKADSPQKADTPQKAERASEKSVEPARLSPSASAPSPGVPSPSAPSPSAPSSSLGSSGAGSPGAVGAAATLRDLPTAFTRAIPPAASRDPAWREHPIGSVGHIRVQLTLGDDGRIVSQEVLRRPGEEVAPELESLVRRVVALLGGGQFALRQSTDRAPVQVLQLEVTRAHGEPSPEAEPTETVRLGFEAPGENMPGRAFFKLGSGLTFEATVRLSSAP